MVGLDALILLAGFVLLTGGGELLVRGASATAERLGVAPAVIGLTVVAFGTSTPELVVNIVAALRDGSELGFGNVVGSNSANIGLLLGLSALLAPIATRRTLVAREIPMMVIGSLAMVVLAATGGADSPAFGYERIDGLILLLLFSVFLYYTLGSAWRSRREAPPPGSATRGEAAKAETGGGFARSFGLVVGGLVLLIAGAELTVRGAIGLATALGVPEAVVALGIVALGTSLPELATCLSAVRQGQGDIALGNIVGSNIFNLLFIWGVTLLIAPADLPSAGMVDLLVMAAFSLVLLPLARTQKRLGRVEGAFLLAGYGVYLGWLAIR